MDHLWEHVGHFFEELNPGEGKGEEYEEASEPHEHEHDHDVYLDVDPIYDTKHKGQK
jgi:hypothetical protein